MRIRQDERLVLYDSAGKPITSVSMPEAHRRVAAFFTPTDGRGHSYGWPERQAAVVLGAIFTGRAEDDEQAGKRA